MKQKPNINSPQELIQTQRRILAMEQGITAKSQRKDIIRTHIKIRRCKTLGLHKHLIHNNCIKKSRRKEIKT